MRISAIICFFIVTAILSAGDMPPEPGEVPYRLVFSDEFDTDGKPAAHWGHEMGYVREGEAQYYTGDNENACVSDGCLHILREGLPTGAPAVTAINYRKPIKNSNNEKQAVYIFTAAAAVRL